MQSTSKQILPDIASRETAPGLILGSGMFGWARKSRHVSAFQAICGELAAAEAHDVGWLIKCVRVEWRARKLSQPLDVAIEQFAAECFDRLVPQNAIIQRLPPVAIWRIVLTGIEQTDLQRNFELDDALLALAARYADFTLRPASLPRS